MKKNIAFIGAGFIAQICHLPIYSQLKQVNIVAICDKDLILAKNVLTQERRIIGKKSEVIKESNERKILKG